MSRKIGIGAAAGLVAGVLFGVLMELLPVPAPTGGRISMIVFAARAVHAQSPLAGWLAYLVYGLIVGGIFGWLLHDQTLEEARSIMWGGVYGLGWWVLAGLVVVPALLGAAPFSSSALAVVRPVALTLLVGHVLYGLVLGAGFPLITERLGHAA
jgi:hypothetical protein